MSKQIVLARGVSLPLDVVNQTIGVIAKRRVGKSYTARRLAEQIYDAGVQLVIVDPKGDHWGIRSAADGKGPGLPIVILGGGHGDVPLEVGSGEIVAKLVAEERVSVLLDLSFFRKHEVATFMTAFLEGVYRLKAHEKFRTPLFMLLEEADAIAPQKPPKGHERMLGAADDIVRRGGQRGIGVALVTQRSAVINKNVLTQCEMLIALKTIAPQDREALEAWIEVHGTKEQRDKLMAELSHLPKGDAYFWSPGWPTDEGIFQRAHVLPIKTFDSGKSPEVGEKRIEPKQLADVDLAALTKQMSATIERAKQDDPKMLRGEIAKLKAELKKASDQLVHALHAPKSPKRADVAAAKKEQLDAAFARGRRAESKRWAQLVRSAEGTLGHLAKLAIELQNAGTGVGALHERMAGDITAAREMEIADTTPDKSFAISRKDVIERIVEDDRAERAAGRPSIASSEIAAGWTTQEQMISGADLAQRIVNTLGSLKDCGIEIVPRVTVAAFVGLHPRTQSFLDALKDAKARGLIDDVSGGGLTLTFQGDKQRTGGIVIRTRSQLHDALFRQLKPLASKILQYLIASHPSDVTREQLAAHVELHVRTESFLDALGTLINLGVVKKVRGGVVAADMLFPSGMPR